MNKYYVTVQRINSISIPVEANSAEEAGDLANAKIARGEILDWDFDLADSYMEAVEVWNNDYTEFLEL